VLAGFDALGDIDHVQNLMGLTDKVHDAQRRSAPPTPTRCRSASSSGRLLRRRVGHDAGRDANLLEPGDAEEPRRRGRDRDDRLQRRAQGDVVPETWTHGSSAMRVRWLRRGLETGDPTACDTFARAEP
jgi:predicted metalloprotease